MGGAPLGDLEGPCLSYLTKCHEVGMAPLQVPFVTGQSKKLSVPNRSLEDRHIPPIAALVSELEVVEDVDLSGNHLLTDRSLAPLLRIFRGRPSASSVLRINLSGCRGLGQETIKSLNNLLRDTSCGTMSLRELDLSSVTIPARCFLMLSSSVGLHGCLEDLRLADTGLGSKSVDVQSCKIISEVLRCKSLACLDIGWSVFSTQVFAHLGVSVASATNLTRLCIPNCSSSAPTGSFRDHPIEHFLERLTSLPALSHLDVSLNRIDYRGALIIEDALEFHKSLTHLDISENYLGVLGLRSLFRCLTSDRSGLRTFRCNDCAASGETSAELSDDGKQVFSATCPGGRYVLDLARPYHRALLRLLYKTCERFHLTPQQAFSELSCSPTGYHHPQKDARGQFVVQAHGRLAFTFKLSWASETKAEGAKLWDFGGFLRRQFDLLRLRPSRRKVVALFAHWRSLEGRTEEQLAMLDAVASDFALTFPQLLELASFEDVANEVLCRTLHCLAGGKASQYLSLCMTSSPIVHTRNIVRLQNLLGFNAENPTGSYTLDLGNPGDGMVAEQLLMLDRWEMEIDQHLKRMDVSQWGNRSHLRNASHNGRPLHSAHMTEWVRPSFGVLRVDYASGKRLPAKAMALDAETFTGILLHLHNSQLRFDTLVGVLRSVSHCLCVKSLQLRELIGCFETDVQRADLAVTFYFRVVDVQNEKVFRAKFADPESIEELRKRLGYATFFPFIQPEFSVHRLDLSQNDQRLATSVLVQLSEKEAVRNLRRYSLTDASGNVDHLPEGVPPSWAQHEKVPWSGVFSVTYIAPSTVRNFAARRGACERCSYTKIGVAEREVVWWSGLNEMPHDVQEFAEWLFPRFPSAKKAYEAFRPNASQPFRISRFRQVLLEEDFALTKDTNGHLQFSHIFRYLDTSGEGEIQESEWMVLEQTFLDISLMLQEFVQYCLRAFQDGDGPAKCLEQAWELLDEDGSGKVEEDAWGERVRRNLGYFSSCDTIFHLLDADRTGSISIKEFRMLGRYLPR